MHVRGTVGKATLLLPPVADADQGSQLRFCRALRVPVRTAGLPLHEAAGAGHTGIVEDLLRGHSDPRVRDAEAETALLRAARRGFVGAVEVAPMPPLALQVEQLVGCKS